MGNWYIILSEEKTGVSDCYGEFTVRRFSEVYLEDPALLKEKLIEEFGDPEPSYSLNRATFSAGVYRAIVVDVLCLKPDGTKECVSIQSLFR